VAQRLSRTPSSWPLSNPKTTTPYSIQVGTALCAQFHSYDDTIVTAIDHEFRITIPSNTSIPAATKSRPISRIRSNSRPPATIRAYAANGKRT